MKKSIVVLLVVLILGIMVIGCVPKDNASKSLAEEISINQYSNHQETSRQLELINIHIEKLDADMMNTRYLLQNEIQRIKSTEPFPPFGFKPAKVLVYIAGPDVSTSAEFDSTEKAIEFLRNYK